MIKCTMSESYINIGNRYNIMKESVVNQDELPSYENYDSFQIEKVIAKIPIESIGGRTLDEILNIWHCKWINCEFYLKGIKY